MGDRQVLYVSQVQREIAAFVGWGTETQRVTVKRHFKRKNSIHVYGGLR